MAAYPLLDLHVHPYLPWIGGAWRKLGRGFRPQSFESPPAAVRRGPEASPPLPSEQGPRYFGAAFYETYLLRPDRARSRLFRALEVFRQRLAPPPVDACALSHSLHLPRPPRLLLTAADLRAVFPALPDHPEVGRGGRVEEAVTGPDGAAPEACFMAVESLRFLRDPGDAALLWDLGVRSLQPIHFFDTRWGGSSREGMLPESRTGLTGFGRELLAEMARLGFILDIAHMGRKNAEECLSAYPGPVMCSHTGLQEVKAGARNLPGELAREIFRRGGIVGVTCWRHLLGMGLGPDPGTDPGPASARLPAMATPGTSLRQAWTRAYCATVAAFARLSPLAQTGVAVGSDRGAPIRAPAWFYSPAHLAEMEACLALYGWDGDRFRAFLFGNAGDFLMRSLPA